MLEIVRTEGMASDDLCLFIQTIPFIPHLFELVWELRYNVYNDYFHFSILDVFIAIRKMYEQQCEQA